MSAPVDIQTAVGKISVQQPVHLAAEDLQFLCGSPKEVEEVVIHHRDKFVAGPVLQAETSALLTEPGLHPGSPRHASHNNNPQHFHSQQGAAPSPLGPLQHNQEQEQGGGDGSHGGGGPDPFFDIAAHMPQARTSHGRQEGDEYVYGTAADSLDFASEEMDAE